MTRTNRIDTMALIERFFDAINAGDSEAALACLSDDVVHDINQGGREVGREKFRWFLAERRRHFDERVADLAVMTDEAGLRAAAEFTLRGTYRATFDGLPEASDQPYAVAAGCFFDIEDGRISRISDCANRTRLIEQLERR